MKTRRKRLPQGKLLWAANQALRKFFTPFISLLSFLFNFVIDFFMIPNYCEVNKYKASCFLTYFLGTWTTRQEILACLAGRDLVCLGVGGSEESLRFVMGLTSVCSLLGCSSGDLQAGVASVGDRCGSVWGPSTGRDHVTVEHLMTVRRECSGNKWFALTISGAIINLAQL